MVIGQDAMYLPQAGVDAGRRRQGPDLFFFLAEFLLAPRQDQPVERVAAQGQQFLQRGRRLRELALLGLAWATRNRALQRSLISMPGARRAVSARRCTPSHFQSKSASASRD